MSIFDVLLQIVAIPFQLINLIVTSALNLLVFDLLQLGPALPIAF